MPRKTPNEARDKALALLENEDPNWGDPAQQLVRATRALAWATIYAGDASRSPGLI